MGGIKFFEQFWLELHPSFMKIGPVVLEKKMFKEIVDGWRMPDTGRSQ